MTHLPLLFPFKLIHMSNLILTELTLLSKNSLSTVLEVVITSSPPVVQTLSCQHVDVALGLLECHSFASGEDSVLQISDKRTAAHEAGEVALSHQHHFDQDDKLFCILLESAESSSHSGPEVPELVRSSPSHHIHHFLCELEWCRLKLHAFSWRVREEEAEINMANIPFDVDHNVFIVTILYLKDITYK